MSGNVQRPGNYEIELGIPVREIVYGLAGGPPEGASVKCWFPGGSSAPVLTKEHLDLPYTFEAMAEAGSMLGSARSSSSTTPQPLVPLALRLAEFYRHESCGKCVPCREGTNWTVKMLERIDEGEGTPMDLDMSSRSRATSSATACACSATRWRCRSRRCSKHFRDGVRAAHGGARAARRDLEAARGRSAQPSWPPRRKREPA